MDAVVREQAIGGLLPDRHWPSLEMNQQKACQCFLLTIALQMLFEINVLGRDVV